MCFTLVNAVILKIYCIFQTRFLFLYIVMLNDFNFKLKDILDLCFKPDRQKTPCLLPCLMQLSFSGLSGPNPYSKFSWEDTPRPLCFNLNSVMKVNSLSYKTNWKETVVQITACVLQANRNIYTVMMPETITILETDVMYVASVFFVLFFFCIFVSYCLHKSVHSVILLHVSKIDSC